MCVTGVGLNLTSTYLTKRLSEEERDAISLEGGQPSLYTLRVGGLPISDPLTFQHLLAEFTFFINFRRLFSAPTTVHHLLPPPTASRRLLLPSTAFHPLLPPYAPMARDRLSPLCLQYSPHLNYTPYYYSILTIFRLYLPSTLLKPMVANTNIYPD